MFDEWPRCIVCVDMNAFFASIEQYLQPYLRAKPIAITNGNQGSCIITASYEARAYGIRTGMRFYEACILCPELIQISSRSSIYASFSKRLMQLLHDEFSPDIEVFSVDEAFLDMTHVHHRFTDARSLAKSIYNRVNDALSLPCSVGIAGDKTTAKYAAKLHKPNGVSVIPPSIAAKILSPVDVGQICGIGPKTKRYLAQYGAQTCGGVSKIPVSILAKKFGIKGQRLWLMCAGKDPDLVKPFVDTPKSMGHSKMLPPGIRSHNLLHNYLNVMAFQLTYRMLLHDVISDLFICSVRLANGRRLDYQLNLITPSAQYLDLSAWIQTIIQKIEIDSPIRKVSVSSPRLSTAIQSHLSQHCRDQKNKLNHLLLNINQRFGRSSLIPARLARILPKVRATQVISPAWKGSVPQSNQRGSFLWD